MNRLSDETSPHLLEHAEHPVDWHPWDSEALELAKRENKPILLSIGYAASHDCHRMAHESFRSNQVAKMMNDDFVCIKVDRDERPDIDRLYQIAHGILTRRPGGWPLTMFLDPHDHLPFFGGTYFPPQARKDAPGFREVLRGMAKTYDQQYDKIKEFKGQLRDALAQTLGGGVPADLDPSMAERACGQIDSSFDAEYGGFSPAPKFPHPAGLELLLDAASSTADPRQSERALHMLDFTLDTMARGGLHDHVGGGFFGYAVDQEWTIPHFEKMLFDNGALLSVYAQRAQQSGSAWLREVAARAADWLERDLQLESGAFGASLDADLDGREGDYYSWRRDRIGEILGDDYDAFAQAFQLGKNANFGIEWHLRLNAPEADTVDLTHNPVGGLESSLAALCSARDAGERPARNEAVITSWNALAIRGLSHAGRLLQRPDLIAAAQKAADYQRSVHWRDGELKTNSRDGQGGHPAYLDDYAFLVDALLVLLTAAWREEDLAFARELADAMIAKFEDPEHGGFFFTGDVHESLIQKSKAFADDSLPSGNGVAVRGLLELGYLSGEPRYVAVAERALRAGMSDAERWPSAHATLMRALIDFSTPAPRVIVRCDDPALAKDWIASAGARLSQRQRCYVIPNDSDSIAACRAEGDVSAYLCYGDVCSEVATTLGEFEALGACRT